MAERKKTLFHVVKPLLTLLNFVYGLNLGNRKPPGGATQLRKKLYKLLIWLFSLINLFLYCHQRVMKADASPFKTRLYHLMYFLYGAFYLFAFNEPEMERLIRRLKQQKIGTTSERVTSKIIMVFLLTLTPVALNLAHIAFTMLKAIYVVNLSKTNGSLFKDILFLVTSSTALLLLGVLVLLFLSLFLFPVLMSLLCCVLVSYCPSRLDDHVEDILRAHSSLRRATLLSKLCLEYYQLQPLASMTNRNMANTMSLMKVVTMLLWVICCYTLEVQNIVALINMPILQYSIPLLMYLVVAPSANDMQLKLFAAAAEVLMVDDEWRGHDPISRSLLIKMRLNLLKHLVHIRMDQSPFTLLGDSVDPETLFTIFIEGNDLRTTLMIR